MTLVDLNLLIYAVNGSAHQHGPARRWWEATLSEGGPVGLAWAVILGFIRLTTNPRVMPHPLPAEQAVAVVDGWMAHPAVEIVEPTERHWGILRDLLSDLGAAGNLTTDAHLAALAVERGARLCSTDNDFSRFARLRWENPLA